MHVQITKADEAENSLILSEKEAWVSTQFCPYPFLLPSFNISVLDFSVLLSHFIFLNSSCVINMTLQEKLYLREGTLLEGTVKKILPYGAQIRIGETNRR